MKSIIIFLAIMIPGEAFSFFLFKWIGCILNKKWDMKINRSVIKGILERLFLFVALINQLPQALIAFGALKIATRFIEDEDNKISLDYFFIGNITSLLISLFYFIIWRLVI